MHFITAQWKLGTLLSLYTNYGLRAVLLGDNSSTLIGKLHLQFPNAEPAPTNSKLHHSMQQLIAYAETLTTPYTAPLEIKGTPFQQTVWRVMRNVGCPAL